MQGWGRGALVEDSGADCSVLSDYTDCSKAELPGTTPQCNLLAMTHQPNQPMTHQQKQLVSHQPKQHSVGSRTHPPGVVFTRGATQVARSRYLYRHLLFCVKCDALRRTDIIL